MGFPLRITFAGMCLLVRDTERADGTKQLHVLLPPVEHHRHLARLVFESRAQDPSRPAHELTHILLDHKELDLTAQTPGGADFDRFPVDVFEMGLLDGRRIERDALTEKNTFGTVLSRVSLAAGKAVDHRPGGEWKIQKASGETIGPRLMATSLVWLIDDVPGPSLELKLNGMNRRANGPTLKLAPATGMTELHLMILNVLEHEVPHFKMELPQATDVPPKDFEATHFGAYYPLWRPSIMAKNPKFGQVVGALDQFARSPQPAAGSEFTCMVATALAERG